MIIPNCYDSHVHFLATGQLSQWVDLRKSESIDSSLNLIAREKFKSWCIGFGWDESNWEIKPHRKHLDELQINKPICLSRIDGHTAWVNSEALLLSGLINDEFKPIENSGEIEIDQHGIATGVIRDRAKTKLMQLIPPPDDSEVRDSLLLAAKLFNRAGFTHVRDMSGTEQIWSCLHELNGNPEFNIALESWIGTESLDGFSSALNTAINIRKSTWPTQVRLRGVKVFMDGALGSETALLSRPYPSGSGVGQQLIARNDLKEVITEVWSHQLPIAIHSIGDRSADIIIEVCSELWDGGAVGELELEHGQMLSHQAVNSMVGRPVKCFMQPCHWSDDKKWLFEKVGELRNTLFRWNDLAKQSIPVFFSSDSPVSTPSVARNLSALEDAENHGILKPSQSIQQFHGHPDSAWVPGCETHFENNQVAAVFFNHQRLSL